MMEAGANCLTPCDAGVGWLGGNHVVPDVGAPFICEGATHRQIWAGAAGLTARLTHALRGSDGAWRGRLCVLVRDRQDLAMALLASLAGGPELVLPHTPLPRLLADLAEQHGCTHALLPAHTDPPPGMAPISLEPGSTGSLSGLDHAPRCLRAPALPFLHLHTGGTTGAAQIWAKSPVNLLAEACYLGRYLGIGSQDRILATVPPYHIYGLLFTVLLPLVTGAQVVDETVFFPRDVAARCRKLRCTVLVGSPAHYSSLVAAGVDCGPSLRLALSSGAPLSAATAHAFQALNAVPVTEVYGSTETGGIATRCQHTEGESPWQAMEPVRWTLHRGRLAVASPFLSPDLPRDRRGYFITSDRARSTPHPQDGSQAFTLLGRADRIVKVAGKRVDLGEVEEQIRRLPGVCDVAAFPVAVPTTAGGQRVGALVVSPVLSEDLLAALRPFLPSQALPRPLKCVASIPRAATGKVDRLAALRLLADDAGSPPVPTTLEAVYDGDGDDV